LLEKFFVKLLKAFKPLLLIFCNITLFDVQYTQTYCCFIFDHAGNGHVHVM